MSKWDVIVMGFSGDLMGSNGIYSDLMGHEWDVPSGNASQNY